MTPGPTPGPAPGPAPEPERGTGDGPLAAAVERALGAAADARAAVLVEGPSDRVAIETLARRRGRDLAAEGVVVVAIGGATNIGRFLGLLGPASHRVTLAGLCDEAEQRYFAAGLERAGFGRHLDRADLEALGFFVCVTDLEDELIRALGPGEVHRVIEDQGELGSLRLFQGQPAQRERPVEEQLRRFMGTRSMRKIRYAGLLVEALDLAAVPRPLTGVLDHV